MIVILIIGLPFASALVTPAALTASEAKLRSRHGHRENDVLNDLFRPVQSEIKPSASSMLHGSQLPTDLPRGAVLKNGPNPRPEFATGQGGWLDGDGLVNCVVLPPDESGPPLYSRTWVRTEGFQKEQVAGRRLFDGSLVAPRGLPLLLGLLLNGLRAFQPQKDTANTGLLPLGPGGRVLALMEQCLPSELQVRRDGSVTTIGSGIDFDGKLRSLARHPFAGGALTAHLKYDADTGERIGVTYPSNGDPGARVTTFSADGSLSSDVMVPTLSPAQTMIHDCAITPTATLILDLPMSVRPSRMLKDKFPVEYEPSMGGRIGLCPRRNAQGDAKSEGRENGDGSDVQWFEVESCVVLHTVNAHESEDGTTVTLTALRSEPQGEASFIESYTPAYLYEWVLDRTSGRCVRERGLSDICLEFPSLDGRLIGKDALYGYAITPSTIGGPVRYGPPFQGILIDGVVKLNLRTGKVAGRWQAPEGYFIVSEPTFVPRDGSEAGDGDEGYLLVWLSSAAQVATRAGDDASVGAGDGLICVPEAADGRASRLYVIDASKMPPAESDADIELSEAFNDGAVAAMELPGAVPYGLHSCWVPWEELPA